MDDQQDFIIRVVTIITLGVILLVGVIGMVLVAIFTDRALLRVELLMFVIGLVIASLGGLSWWRVRRRRRWRLRVDGNGDD